jgi:hypothetical protein
MKTAGIIGMALLTITYSCGAPESSTESGNEQETIDTTATEIVELTNAPDGFQLMESTCFSCHSPNSANETNVAPTIADIKLAYLNEYPQGEQFIAAMQEFLANPNAESAIMKESVTNYGLMPQMSLLSEQSNAIASYLFQNQVEADSWFSDEYPKEQARVLANKEHLSYVDRGFEYAMATKSVLGKNLKGKINAEGTLAAVNFCNLNAVHFTDSISAVYDAEIKRVSDQPRNANNQANDEELLVINDFKMQLANGEEIIPVTAEKEEHVFGYYPIVTNDMCLKCHGDVGGIDEATHAKIQLLYPQDKATGYATNQLRGIWVVKMMK